MHHHTRSPSARWLLPALLLPTLAAQAPSPAPTRLDEPLLVAIHELAPDPIGGGGGTFAVGGDYKVRFDGGMVFVPYLGGDYPHNQPFGWRTSSITIGGEPLALHPAAERGATPWRYEYDLGPVVEAYDVRAEGLEQTFSFAVRPGNGELRIRGALQTDLHATRGVPGHGDLTFADEHGTALIGYSAAFAVDADGRRWPMTTSVGDGTLDLVLSAEQVAAATWPLVVDPLLTNVTLSTTGVPPFGVPNQSDVGRDDANNQLLVALQRSASATDQDLFVRLFGDAFTPSLGIVFADTDPTWSTREACVAFVGGASRWAVGFTRDFSTTGTLAVRWHPHTAASAVLDTTVGFVTPGAGNSDLHPAIGGYAAFATGVHAVLCWQRDLNLGAGGTHTSDPNSRLYFARIDLSVAGTGTLGAATELIGTDPSGACDRERPTINRTTTGTAASHHMIVWQTYWNTAPGGVDDWDVEGKRLDGTGTFLPGVWIAVSDFPNNDHKLGPQVDGNGDEYVIAYALADNTIIPFKAANTLGSRVALESYDFAAPAIGMPGILFDTGFVKSLRVTGLAYDTVTRSHAAVVYHDQFTATQRAAKTGFRNLVSEDFAVYSVAGQTVAGGGATFDDDAQAFRFVFGVDNGGTLPVYGSSIDYVASAAPTLYGNPVCPGPTIYWNGFHRLGYEFGSINMIGGPAVGIALLDLSLASANVPLGPFGLGNCTLLIDPTAPAFLGSLAMLTSPTGTASVPLAVPETLSPFDAHFQWLVFTGTLAMTQASAGLVVPFDR